MSGVYDSQGFNDYWKVTIFGFEGTTIMNNFFSLFDSQWAKQNVIDFIQNQTYWNSFVMGASVALSQWKNLEKVTSGLSAGMAGLKLIKFLKSLSKVSVKQSTATARSLGIAGEKAVGIGSKRRIPSFTGTEKYRIPDGLTSTTLTEVKNVKHLSLTRQLRDFHMYSKKNGLQFELYTRLSTTYSGPLQNLINQGSIIVKDIPGL